MESSPKQYSYENAHKYTQKFWDFSIYRFLAERHWRCRYPSATAGFCAAHTVAMRQFFASDDLNWDIPRPAGSSVREPGVTPAANTTLSFATWTQFDEECGQSRVWGGVHFPDAVPAGQSIGREVGEEAFKFFQDHLKGEGVAGILRA